MESVRRSVQGTGTADTGPPRLHRSSATIVLLDASGGLAASRLFPQKNSRPRLCRPHDLSVPYSGLSYRLVSGTYLKMRTAFDIDVSSLDEQERRFLDNIRDHGWFDNRIFDDESVLPDFSYTSGFYSSLEFPEVILFSLSKEVSHSILWDLYRDIQSGKSILVGAKTREIFGNAEAILLPVAKSQYEEHLGWNRWFYRGDDFPCLQLVWPDPEGRFPWEANFDERLRDYQPDLTEFGWGSLFSAQ